MVKEERREGPVQRAGFAARARGPLEHVDPRSAIGQEETFGSVVTVTPYDTEEEAGAIANTVYGLAGQVSSGDSAGQATPLARAALS